VAAKVVIFATDKEKSDSDQDKSFSFVGNWVNIAGYREMLKELMVRMRRSRGKKSKHCIAEGRFEVADHWMETHPRWHAELHQFRTNNSASTSNEALHDFATNFVAHFCAKHKTTVSAVTWRYILQDFDDTDEQADRLGVFHSDCPYIGSGVLVGYIIVAGSTEKPVCRVRWQPYKGANDRPEVSIAIGDGAGYYTTDDVGDVFIHKAEVDESVTRKWALVIGIVSKAKSDHLDFDARKGRFGADLHWRRRKHDGRVVPMKTLR
jgi:hypothetical protein